jgi:hypothetical protein
MRHLLCVLAAALALTLTAGGCCSMNGESCKADGKAMTCDMKAGCSCCKKGAAEGAPSQAPHH